MATVLQPKAAERISAWIILPPNIAKPFGIHHITTTVLGNSLRRIFDHLGYKTVSINHLGDWGTQFGKMIVAYDKWGDREKIENGNSVRELVALYVKFMRRPKKTPLLRMKHVPHSAASSCANRMNGSFSSGSKR